MLRAALSVSEATRKRRLCRGPSFVSAETTAMVEVGRKWLKRSYTEAPT